MLLLLLKWRGWPTAVLVLSLALGALVSVPFVSGGTALAATSQMTTPALSRVSSDICTGATCPILSYQQTACSLLNINLPIIGNVNIDPCQTMLNLMASLVNATDALIAGLIWGLANYLFNWNLVESISTGYTYNNAQITGAPVNGSTPAITGILPAVQDISLALMFAAIIVYGYQLIVNPALGQMTEDIRHRLPRFVLVGGIIMASGYLGTMAIDMTNAVLAALIPSNPFQGNALNTLYTNIGGAFTASTVSNLVTANVFQQMLQDIFLIILGITLLFIGVQIVLRWLFLDVLIVLMPLAALGTVLPGGEGFTRWWGQAFVSTLVVWPVQGLVLALGLQTAFASAQPYDTVNYGVLVEPAWFFGTLWIAQNVPNMLNFSLGRATAAGAEALQRNIGSGVRNMTMYGMAAARMQTAKQSQSMMQQRNTIAAASNTIQQQRNDLMSASNTQRQEQLTAARQRDAQRSTFGFGAAAGQQRQPVPTGGAALTGGGATVGSIQHRPSSEPSAGSFDFSSRQQGSVPAITPAQRQATIERFEAQRAGASSAASIAGGTTSNRSISDGTNVPASLAEGSRLAGPQGAPSIVDMPAQHGGAGIGTPDVPASLAGGSRISGEGHGASLIDAADIAGMSPEPTTASGTSFFAAHADRDSLPEGHAPSQDDTRWQQIQERQADLTAHPDQAMAGYQGHLEFPSTDESAAWRQEMSAHQERLPDFGDPAPIDHRVAPVHSDGNEQQPAGNTYNSSDNYSDRPDVHVHMPEQRQEERPSIIESPSSERDERVSGIPGAGQGRADLERYQQAQSAGGGQSVTPRSEDDARGKSWRDDPDEEQS